MWSSFETASAYGYEENRRKLFGEDISWAFPHGRNTAAYAGVIAGNEPDTQSILRDLGGINMNGERFIAPSMVDKVIIRTKDGREFEGSVTRSEYMPGMFGRYGYSDLTVRTEAPSKAEQYGIKKVIFNNPATIVFWEDGTRTVVYCNDNMQVVKKTVGGKTVEVKKPMKADTYSEETGLAMAIVKKHRGNTGAYNNIFKKFIPGMKEREKAAKKEARKSKREAAENEQS